MGVTISCKKTGHSVEMSNGGFFRWRMKVAELCNPVWYLHYKTLENGFSCAGAEEQKKFFQKFDRNTKRLLDENRVGMKLVDFCLQPDTDGKVRYGACKEILKGIGSYSDRETEYGYTGRKQHISFETMKKLLKECADNKCDLVWH